MTLQAQHTSVLKQLRVHVKDLNREHRNLSKQLEKVTRYADGPNKAADKLEREILRVEKLMAQIENAIKFTDELSMMD